MAKKHGAAVTIYHALEPSPLYFHSGSPQLTPDLVKRLEEAKIEAGERLAGAAKRLAEQAGLQVNAEVDRPNTPADGIVDAAKRVGCDIIFMASHGRAGIERLLLGSVTQKVLVRTDLPVMVYRVKSKKHHVPARFRESD